MTSYYNEWDEKTASWLRVLIAAGRVPPGDVDTRSISEVRPDDLKGYTQCHFFAGIGGWPLALQYAGWPADRPVWTGSCPCQPFSLAGAQKGFADTRHLWPEFLRLIGIGRPANLFGEQVASATAWLGLVRGDLEALGYAVGAMPIEAASAGADHLRDRFWFVGDYQGDGRGERRPEHGVLVGQRPAFASTGCVGLADAHDARSRGRPAMRECAGERPARPDGVANAAGERRHGGEDTTGQAGRHEPQGDCGDLSDAERIWLRGQGPAAAAGSQGGMQGADEERERLRPNAGPVRDAGDYEWAMAADGKARRVKPGVRLLVNGFPCRMGLLRGFGNAIDPRPAAAFIQAADEAIRGCA